VSQYTKLLTAITAVATSNTLFYLAIGWGWPPVYRTAGIIAGGVVGALWMVVRGALRDDRAKHEPIELPAPREPETDSEQPVTEVPRLTDGPVKHRK
jgi:hypothetical protein